MTDVGMKACAKMEYNGCEDICFLHCTTKIAIISSIRVARKVTISLYQSVQSGAMRLILISTWLSYKDIHHDSISLALYFLSLKAFPKVYRPYSAITLNPDGSGFWLLIA